jgi:hypothetical protein
MGFGYSFLLGEIILPAGILTLILELGIALGDKLPVPIFFIFRECGRDLLVIEPLVNSI